MGHQRLFNLKAYATVDERCTVKLYRSFISHRPKSMCEDSSPLFLAGRHGIEYKNNVIWYHAKPLGVNSIGQFMSKASTSLNSNVSGKIANYSCRKTSITNILNSDIHPLFVTQISGHKKVDSLNNYNVASLETQKKISAVLNDGDFRPSASYSSSTSVSNTYYFNRIRRIWNDEGMGYAASSTNAIISKNTVICFNVWHVLWCIKYQCSDYTKCPVASKW